MPFCGSCGKKYDEELKFCPYCGVPNALLKAGQETPVSVDSAFQTRKRDGNTYGAYRLEDLPEGFVIDDRYEVKEKLGQGGFGAVYRAFDRSLSVDKAIKIIPGGLAADREAMKELRREARTLVSLTHDAIVRVYDVHDAGRIKYIDMEYVDGKALTDIKLDSERGVLPEQDVRELALKIIGGLSYAHSKGVIHKDIKPQNIVVTGSGEVKIMDFGISESLRASMSRLANSSSSGTLVYMAPEQVKGEDVGPEVDIYSFGVTLYELLAGHPPFWKGDIHYQVFNETPKSMEGVSEEMNVVILKCLEKDYRERFRGFGEVTAALSGKTMVIHQLGKTPQGQELLEKRNMVLVEGGTFMMGAEDGDDDEKPVHSVTVSSFYLSEYAVTQGLWKEIMGSNPSDKRYGIGSRYPVNNVSWYDTIAFCNKLSEWDGLQPAYRISGDNVIYDWSKNGYRLPMEEEWEYAAKGGKDSNGYTYAGSSSIGDVAWYVDNSRGKLHPVGKKLANELGLYDMSGNVWEWCWDLYGDYSSGRQQDLRGASEDSNRIGRGGSWRSGALSCRLACRGDSDPVDAHCNLGFRLARSVVQ